MSFSLIFLIVVLFGMLLIGAPVIMAIGTAAMAYFFTAPGMAGELMMYAHRLFTGSQTIEYAGKNTTRQT